MTLGLITRRHARSPFHAWRLHAWPLHAFLALAAGMLVLFNLSAPSSAEAQLVDDERPPGWDGDEGRDYLAEPDVPADPHRILWTAGAGSSFRLIKDLDLAQVRFAPAYVDLFGAFVFGGHTFRHGIGLNLGINISGDGNDSVGVDPFSQLVLSPTYLAYLRLSDDFILTGKVAASFVLTPNFSPGAEIAVGPAIPILSGFGLYGEVGFSMFFAADSAIHPLVSGELGLYFDYEMLP